MNEGRELLKSIQPLKFVVNPFFFVTFYMKETGFFVSKTGMAVVLCSLSMTLCFKMYFIIRHPGKQFEEYVEKYGSLAPAVLCVLSYLGYTANSKSIVRDLNLIISKSGYIKNKQFYKRIARVAVLQVMICHALPFCASVWMSYHFYEDTDYFLTFIGNTGFDYFIMLHFAATSLVFSNTILFCRRIITKANEQLELGDVFDSSKPEASLERLFVKHEKVSRIRLQSSNEFLITMILNYDKVCQWCLDFNEHFGGPLAACCISNLIEMILYSYYLTKYGIVELWMFVFIFSYCFMQTWVILYACEKFKKEVQNTGIIVNRLLLEAKTNNRKELLQQFSMLLLHRKVKFTACGMFSLDYKLIYSAIATVATYLAVAFQFEYAGRSSQRNSSRNVTENSLGIK